MGRGFGFLAIVIAFAVFSLFALYFEINLNYSIFDAVERTITGKAVDNGNIVFDAYAEYGVAFENKTSETIAADNVRDVTGLAVLDKNCVIEKVSWNKKYARLGEAVRLDVSGNKDCAGPVYARFLDKDLFRDDFIIGFEGSFIDGTASFELLIDESYSYLFDEGFEDGNLEVYAVVRTSDSKKISEIIFVSDIRGVDIDLSPATETGGSEEGGIDNPADILTPGSGWTGLTNVPAPIGTSSVEGYDATPIAHWDMVPFQDVNETINVGVMAYHFNGVEKVSFSVNNGPWIDVASRTLNPETGVEEYWVVLDASRFSTAGSVEIRAIAYPQIAGQVKVLQGTMLIQHDSSMILNVDPINNLQRRIRYVSTGGIDGVNCGQSISAPCLTISAGINSASISGNLDGAELRLGQGTWQLPELPGTLITTTRWFTIASAENTNKDEVIINGFSTQTGSGLNLRLIKLEDISLINPMRSRNNNDYFWLEDSKAYYLGDIVPSGSCPAGSPFLGGYGHAGAFSGSYFTNVFMNNTCTGPRANTLIRNVYAEYTGDGHATGTHTVINYRPKRTQQSNGIPGTPGEYHGDVYQLWDATENIILYNVRNLPGAFFYGRGIVDSTPAVKDIAIDKVYIDLGFPGTYAGADTGFAFSFCNDIDHLVVKDSNFVGPADWCGEIIGGWSVANPSTMKNILIDNTMFEQNHWPNWLHYIPLPYPAPMGIRYVNAPITCTSGQTLSCPIQEGVCSGTQRTCAANGEFTECIYNTLPNYQQIETITNDGLDNDCDGVVDGGYGAPSPPYGLTVTALSSSSLRLDWRDNNFNEDHFEILRRDLPGGSFVFIPAGSNLPSNTITFTDTGLAANSSYEYAVMVDFGQGSSLISNVANGTTLSGVPNAPGGLNVTAINSTSLRLNWIDNSNNELGFTLQYKLSSGSTFQNVPNAGSLIVNTTNHTHNGLINNTSYDYRILAFNGAGNSSFSSAASGTTLQNPAHIFTLSRTPTSGIIQQGSDTQIIVTATYVSGTSNNVIFNATNLSSGVSALFTPSSCTPTNGIPCSTTLILTAFSGATIVNNRQVVIVANSWLSNVNTTYLMNVTAPPICTNGQIQLCPLQLGVCLGSQQICASNNWSGCTSANYGLNYSIIETGVAMCIDGLDNDCDINFDLGRDDGCPIPIYSGFNSSLTTNLSNVTDFTRVRDFSIGINDLGRIQYSGQEISLWRLVSGVYNAINLNNAIRFENNLISVDTLSYSELNQTATLTIYNLTYSSAPTPLISTNGTFEVCSDRCVDVNYSNGIYIMGVTGFSNYSTQAAECGDTYCSLGETCSSCSGDCGTCSSPSPGPSGGGGGGGGSRRTSNRTIMPQCSDRIDNDGDLLIDYPADLGCLNALDNIELDSSTLEIGEESVKGSSSDDDSFVEDVEVKSVFLITLTVLIAGIIISLVFIIVYLRKHRKLSANKLANQSRQNL